MIESTGAGPHGAFGPKACRAFSATQELADPGLIVVQIDGLGPSHRSKTFRDAGWQNLGDAGRPDRVRWIRAAARTRPEMDRARVGIDGTSSGARLTHGDFYRAAASDCGGHDNRRDKIGGERAAAGIGRPRLHRYSANSTITPSGSRK